MIQPNKHTGITCMLLFYTESMINGIQIEICIGNVEDAVKASKYPIDRIELNCALELGGLSPGIETLKYLKEHIETPICVMCRPRGGDFCYNETEYEVMYKEAEEMLENGADGIVFGYLKEDRTIDEAQTKKMVELIHSYGREAVFHKAFDETEDLEDSVQRLIDLKIDRILTSGKAPSAKILEGCEVLRPLQEKYGDKIQFLPGGGVKSSNASDVLKISGCRQIHMTAKRQNPGGYFELDERELEDILRNIEAM